jgi:hypothetical protein
LSIQESVLNSFFDLIANDPSIPDPVAEQLRSVLALEAKLPTADQLARVFSEGTGDTLA